MDNTCPILGEIMVPLFLKKKHIVSSLGQVVFSLILGRFMVLIFSQLNVAIWSYQYFFNIMFFNMFPIYVSIFFLILCFLICIQSIYLYFINIMFFNMFPINIFFNILFFNMFPIDISIFFHYHVS